ncbi:acyl-CoA dehydrogenase [Frankia sp. QA3]|uniref:acyl-CoA dehydrogenase n=1 Tax=Frankia sp. QA3 TaxID=710111 RepID=UPI000269BBAD|nr:acyl-CoA dehydrogenase [Frankia sp. QA3]EIV91722.1 acyl-CoA dehydrogenase [Frankia sp. QA3]
MSEAPETSTTVRAAGTLAGRHAAAGDAERRLRPEVVDALVDAGFGRWFTPPEFGGEPRSYRELAEAVTTVGEGCASAAWVAGLLAGSARFAGFLPPQGQAEVWEKGPDARLVAAVVPQGTAAEVDGGWLVSGTWSFVSGVEFSDWAIVLGPVVPGVDEGRFFVVPRSDYTITDTWFTLGMRATGSQSLTLEEVFVPSRRSFPRAELLAGRPEPVAGPRRFAPLFAVNGLTFGCPILGAARGALRIVEESLTQASAEGRAVRDSARIALARAAGEIDAAELLLARVARSADHDEFTPALIARSHRDSALCAALLTSAVDALHNGSGVRGEAQSDPLQRVWRDVHAGAKHIVLQFEPAALHFTEHLVRPHSGG